MPATFRQMMMSEVVDCGTCCECGSCVLVCRPQRHRLHRWQTQAGGAAVDGVFEVRPMSEFETSMEVLLRLARKQRQRVPVPPGRAETFAPARVH